MAVFTFDPSGSPINIELASFSEGAPTLVGDTDRAFDLSAQSCARGEIRTWPIVTEPVDTVTKDAIKALIALQAEIQVAGDVFGATLTVIVKDNGWSRFTGTTEVLWQGSLTVEEATAA